MKRLVLGLALVALAVMTAACSGGAVATSAPAGSPAASGPAGSAGDGIVLVAKDLAFAPAAITVPAGEAFEVLLDNQESAPHNLAIKDAGGSTVYKGEIVSSAQVVNNVPAMAAGTYQFFCEVHPNMTGTLTVE